MTRLEGKGRITPRDIGFSKDKVFRLTSTLKRRMNWESGGKFVLGKKQSVEDQLIQCSASGDLTLKLETNVS